MAVGIVKPLKLWPKALYIVIIENNMQHLTICSVKILEHAWI